MYKLIQLDAVFFASYCGISRDTDLVAQSSGHHLVPAPVEEESDLRCLSVREAVNFAKSTNLLGVILEASTLVRFWPSRGANPTMSPDSFNFCLVQELTISQAAVPSLVASVKDAGLLLATCGDSHAIAILKQGASDGRMVDAFVHDG